MDLSKQAVAKRIESLRERVESLKRDGMEDSLQYLGMTTELNAFVRLAQRMENSESRPKP